MALRNQFSRGSSSTKVWHDKEPAIEFAVYRNDAFAFSSATIEDILGAGAAPPTPWQGQMMALEPPVGPTLSGLRLLNSALLDYDNGAPWRSPFRTMQLKALLLTSTWHSRSASGCSI